MEASVAVRDVAGRLGGAVADGASADLRSVTGALVLDGRADAAADRFDMRRAAVAAPGFLFSSPEVRADRSGSGSDPEVLEAARVRLAAFPGTGRVGGLLRLEPTVLVRVEEASGLTPSAFAAELDAGTERFADAAVDEAAVGRRGAADPGLAEDDAAFFRTDDGDDGTTGFSPASAARAALSSGVFTSAIVRSGALLGRASVTSGE